MMIQLNGIPAIMGMSFIHITLLNLIAIIIEYFWIKKRHQISLLLLRVILANLFSLLVALVVLYTLPTQLGGNLAPADENLESIDKLILVFTLFVMLLVNVLLEFSIYMIGKRKDDHMIDLLISVFIANLLSNIPVFILYGLLMIG